MDTVLVARPGALVNGEDRVDEYTARMGGDALYPSTCGAPDAGLTACKVCGQDLKLVLQAYAPLPACQERFLYVFGCTAAGCGTQPGSWRALRCQAPAAAAPPALPPSVSQDASGGKPQGGFFAVADLATAADGGGGWGVGSGGWGDSEAEPCAGGSAFDFSDLDAALDAAAAKGPTVAPAAQQQQQERDAHAAARAPAAAQPAPVRGGPPGAPALPSFYLLFEPEAEQPGGGGRGGGRADEGGHLRALLARYEAEAGGVGAPESGAAPALRGSKEAAAAGAEDGGVAPESWGGEGFEQDTVLRPPGRQRGGGGGGGGEAAFLKFAKRLARCPDQCARYSFNGPALWPGAAPPPPPPCAACGGPRVFEVQLTTPAIAALEEAVDWVEAERGAAAAHTLRPPASWEWATVAVRVCGASCAGGGGVAFAEEEVALLNEEAG